MACDKRAERRESAWVTVAMRATNGNQLDKQTLPRLAYKPAEAAYVLGLNQFTIYRLLKRGLLKSSGGLRHKLIPHSELERYLKATAE